MEENREDIFSQCMVYHQPYLLGSDVNVYILFNSRLLTYGTVAWFDWCLLTYVVYAKPIAEAIRKVINLVEANNNGIQYRLCNCEMGLKRKDVCWFWNYMDGSWLLGIEVVFWDEKLMLSAALAVRFFSVTDALVGWRFYEETENRYLSILTI